MAPKRARVFQGSSSNRQSSDEDSSAIRGAVNKFTSAEAQTEYNRLLTRAVARERGFLPTASSGDLLAMIQDRGWEGICEAPAAVPLSIVKEFYANARADKNGFYVVRGLTVDYNAPVIREILRPPAQPEDTVDWTFMPRAEVDLDEIVETLCVPGTVWKLKAGTNEPLTFPASTMNRYARAWNMFICANLLTSSHAHDVTVERAILLWAILNNFYIDLGLLIHQNILRFLKDQTVRAIPHGSIITRLCTSVGVRWSSEEQVQLPSAAIDDSSISRMEEWAGGVPCPDGLGYEIHGAGGAGVPRVRRAVPRTRASEETGMSASQYRRMMRRMDAMYDSNRLFAQDLTHSLGSAFAASGVQVTWPVYGTHAVYPPPDSPPEGGDHAGA